MKKIKDIFQKTVVLMLAIIGLSGCAKEQIIPFDSPFFYIHVNNSDELRIQANRSETVDYKIYLSSKLQFDPITVNYEIVAKEGLQEGVDYEVITKSNQLVFKPGVLEMPITIRWISRAVDESKDNRLIIRILSNDKNINIGLPGPDKKQSALTITKF